jgi:DNA-nicking Smr family endonuclease
VRRLSPDEAALWARVASTIRPLSREKNDEQAIEFAPRVAAVFPPRKVAPTAPARPLRGPGTTLDGSWDRRLRNGSIEPERVVDLHGMTLDRAWQAIDRALDQAVIRGERVVLLVTGHHRPGEAPIRRGAIRAAVHDWLAA